MAITWAAPFSICSGELLENGIVSQAWVEALALLLGLDWVRKGQKLSMSLFADNGMRPLGQIATFISDRTATLVTMEMLGRQAPETLTDGAGDFRGYLFELAHSLVKMLLSFFIFYYNEKMSKHFRYFSFPINL